MVDITNADNERERESIYVTLVRGVFYAVEWPEMGATKEDVENETLMIGR